MPTIECRSCRRYTNTAVSDHINSKDGKADRCFAAWEDGGWVKGCAYEEADLLARRFADKLIAKPE